MKTQVGTVKLELRPSRIGAELYNWNLGVTSKQEEINAGHPRPNFLANLGRSTDGPRSLKGAILTLRSRPAFLSSLAGCHFWNFGFHERVFFVQVSADERGVPSRPVAIFPEVF